MSSQSVTTLVTATLLGGAAVWYIYRRRRGLKFHIVDVFTTGDAFSGNQLLVVEDRNDLLSDQTMQIIAAEIGFAESAFVCCLYSCSGPHAMCQVALMGSLF